VYLDRPDADALAEVVTRVLAEAKLPPGTRAWKRQGGGAETFFEASV